MNQKLHCAKCDTYKSPNEFYKHKGRPQGRAAYCIQCERAMPRRYNTGKGQIKGSKGSTGPTGPRKPRRLTEVLPNGMLRCNKCKEVKPTCDFHKYSTTKRGWAYECKLCRYVVPVPKTPKTRKIDEAGNLCCTKCDTHKPSESFYSSQNYRNSGYSSQCRACILGHEPKPKRFKSDSAAECSQCKAVKPLSMFQKSDNLCKPCRSKKDRDSRKAIRLSMPPRIPFGRHSKYKRHAKERNLIFEITVEQFNTMTALPCSYCGTTNKVGVDRANNSIGYVISNCVPCCGVCNFIKRTMSVKELKEQLIRMTKHMGLIL